jgi:hypothetical protein
VEVLESENVEKKLKSIREIIPGLEFLKVDS